MAKKSIQSEPKPTHEEIARRAYEIFEERGRPHGRDQEHWLEAEAQLKAPKAAINLPAQLKNRAVPAPLAKAPRIPLSGS